MTSITRLTQTALRSSCLQPMQKLCKTPKRGLHRGLDRPYLELWKRKGVDFSQMQGANFYQSPQLIERIMRVMLVARLNGEYPFVTAFPASSKVLIKMYDVAAPKKTEMPTRFKYLRSPNGPESHMTKDMVKTTLFLKLFGAGKGPGSVVPKPGVLSVSYALTSGIEKLESAASWGFINHFGKYNYLPVLDNYRSFLKEMGVDKENPGYSYLVKRACSLIRKYNRLKIGDFHVISVPRNKVDHYVFDSHFFNIPTGRKASEVADNPLRYQGALYKYKTHMATMFLCDETIHPSSGISVITANDPKEVDSFCVGHMLTSMKEVPAYNGLVSPVPTSFEEHEVKEREKLGHELDLFVRQFQTFLSTGSIDESTASIPIEKYLPEDLPDSS